MEKEIHSHEWWLPYIEECLAMHISLHDYCHMKGFDYNAFYWHWRKERQTNNQINTACETQIYPVVIARTENSIKRIEINGVEVSGSTEDLRDLLGIRI